MKYVPKVVFTSLVLVSLTACGSVKESKSNNLQLDVPSISNGFKSQYLNAINNARSISQNCGSYGSFSAAPLLKWSDKLYGAAYEHSNDMATTNTFSHNGSGQESDKVGRLNGNKSTAGERINAYGYRWVLYAENIGAGTDIDTADKIVNQLLASDGHCANIMNPRLTEVGMAMVKNSNTKYVHYWTQDFGTHPN